jgi:hypothetical protein
MTAGQMLPAARADSAARADVDACECARLVGKLRWIGLDEEAGLLEQALRDLLPEQRGTIFAEPRSTD